MEELEEGSVIFESVCCNNMALWMAEEVGVVHTKNSVNRVLIKLYVVFCIFFGLW